MRPPTSASPPCSTGPERHGRLYGLVNIAGGAAPDTWMPATRVTRQAWRDLFTQNLETMFFASQAVAEELRTQGLPDQSCRCHRSVG